MSAASGPLRALIVTTSVWLAFPAHAFLDQILKPLAAQPAQGQAPAQNAQAVAGQAAALSAAANCLVQKTATAKSGKTACTPLPAMATTRKEDEFDALLNGQELSGEKLMVEMKALRTAVATHSLNNAMATMMGGLAPQAAAQGAGLFANNGGSFFSSLFSSVTDAALDLLVSELSYQALDHFFSVMTDQPGLLKEVSVTLPKADATMTREMKQQLVNMAGFLVAIKASGKIIDSSEKDFDAAKESYRKVLEARMAAAKLLGDAFYARAGLAAAQEESQAYLSAEQQEFLAGMAGKTAEELMKDFAVQNIALDYLRKKDPAKYGDYKAGVDDFKSHYGAYARTSVGAASMLGFSSIFLKRAKNMLEKNGVVAAPPLISLVGDGLSETVSLVPRVIKVFERSPDLQDGSFSVRKPSGEIVRELNASKAFSALSDESRSSFQASLFKDGQLGYFGQLGEKFPLAGGHILDALVQKENRNKFSKGYFEREDWPDFSFQNVLSGQTEDVDPTQLRQFRNDLFRSAPPVTASNEDQQAIAVVQQDVRERLSKWDNSTLRRIILSNRGKSQAGVELALNDYTLTVDSPGMRGIMEYEEMASTGAEHASLRTVTSDRVLISAPAAKAESKSDSKVETKGKGKAKGKSK